jgi:predicted dehydrogenase
VAAIQACDVKAYLIFEIHLLGTRGRFRVISSGFDATYEAASGSPRFAGYRELSAAEPAFRPQPKTENMLAGVAHLLECLRTGSTPVSAGEDGYAALEIISALRLSSETGRKVGLHLADVSAMTHSR